MEEPKYIPSLDSNTLENIDELVMFARERRGVLGLSFSLLLVKALAGVLTEQKRTYKNQEGANSDVAPYVPLVCSGCRLSVSSSGGIVFEASLRHIWERC